jgi:hypothetical protein
MFVLTPEGVAPHPLVVPQPFAHPKPLLMMPEHREHFKHAARALASFCSTL